MLSLQASYAAPLLLLAQNRQDDRDRSPWTEDRQRAERNLPDTEYLTRELAALRIALRDVATRDYVRGRTALGLLEDMLESRRTGARRSARRGDESPRDKVKEKLKDRRDKQRSPDPADPRVRADGTGPDAGKRATPRRTPCSRTPPAAHGARFPRELSIHRMNPARTAFRQTRSSPPASR